MNYTTSRAPPIFILHGDQETPCHRHSGGIHDRLQTTGVTSRLIVVTNANNRFAPMGGPISPTRQDITRIVVDFFDEHVGDAGAGARR